VRLGVVACVVVALGGSARAQFSPRSISGHAVPVDAMAGGSADVKLTYDDFKDARPPSSVVVSLVGYRADGAVTVAQVKTDIKGIAHFTKLDTSGSVAYFALAQLPRGHAADRLVAEAVVPVADKGVSITLSALKRTAPDAPLDDAFGRQNLAVTAVAKGNVQVRIEGVPDPKTKVDVIDAATGKSLATTETDKEALLAVPARAGQIVYADAVARGEHYRSLPIELVADRGAPAMIYIYPRILPTYAFQATADDASLTVVGKISIANNSWLPYAEGAQGPSIPLPRGATKIEISDDTRALVRIVDGRLDAIRPLPPGPSALLVAFELPAPHGEVAWSLDVPHGSFKSSFAIDQEPGASIDHVPPGTKVDVIASKQVVDDITIVPKKAMTMTVHLAKPSRDNAVLHACRRLRPDATPLVGKPLDFTLKGMDGKAFRLSSLRGKVVLVNLMATWDMLSSKERPTLAAIADKIAIVMVASDKDPKEVASTVGAQRFPVVLDPPAKPDDNIGALTSSLGVTALPENLLVDRKGIVRFHFQNARAWDQPEELRCVKALAAEP
jgi:hypothetical protein